MNEEDRKMNKTGCVIVKDFKRPERELVERFAGVAVLIWMTA